MTQNVWQLDGRCGLSREEIGNKAYGINRMIRLGIAVPAAFVLAPGGWSADGVWVEVRRAIEELETASGSSFGGVDGPPLLVSVRSGAAISMPGMMDTILNVGATSEVLEIIGCEDAALASDLVFRVDKRIHADADGKQRDAFEQLRYAIDLVERSWDSDRSRHYRRARGISDEHRSAVVVQVMVYGNRSVRSGSGVAFSRNPVTGEDCLTGEWARKVQGEDVVSGRVTGQSLVELSASVPDAFRDLEEIARKLEREFLSIQDIEFTIDAGTLWILQCRSAVVSTEATLRFVVSMAESGAISRQGAVGKLGQKDIADLRRPRLVTTGAALLATGRVASPGFATGRVQSHIDFGSDFHGVAEPESAILVRHTTDPDDVPMMSMASAVITEMGGSTSHAAIVCRELKIPCIVGCGPGVANRISGLVVTVDGDTGNVFDGQLATSDAVTEDDHDLAKFLTWSKEVQSDAD